MILKVLRFKFLAIAGMLVFASCSENADTKLVDNTLSSDDVAKLVLVDDINADIDNILEDDDNDFNLSAKGGDQSTSSVAECVVRTVAEDPNNQTKTITLDFGDGCTGKRGREFSGKIIIVYQRTDNGYSKSVTFENFVVDGNKIEGSKAVSKVKENASGNKEATHTVNITISLATGQTVTMEGTRTREKIEGGNTVTRGDDVYLISGNWRFVNKDGETFTGNITEKLRREYACKFIVSGITEISKNGTTYTLNFGDGSCDNKATVTNAAGESREITLRGK